MRALAWTKRGLRVACAGGAVCALLAAAALAAARGGVTGTVTYVSDLQTLAVSTEDGTIIRCGAVTGTVKDASGLLTHFNVGGVLSLDGRLAPDVQDRIDTLRAVQASGGTLVATLAYDDELVMLCGSPLANFVTGVSSAPAPSPTPTPTLDGNRDSGRDGECHGDSDAGRARRGHGHAGARAAHRVRKGHQRLAGERDPHPGRQAVRGPAGDVQGELRRDAQAHGHVAARPVGPRELERDRPPRRAAL